VRENDRQPNRTAAGPNRAAAGPNGTPAAGPNGVPNPVPVPSAAAPKPLRVACGLVALQALGLVAAGIALLAESVTGHPNDRASAILGAGFALLGAVALGLGARGLLRLRPSARMPVVVLEILTVPIGYQLAFDSERPEWGGPILLCALAVLYLIFTPPARAVLDREEPGR
jgi:hypothetical protein